MTQQAIDRARPESSGRDLRTRPRTDAGSPRWLRLALTGALGIVAGAMLFPTRAEGAPRPTRAEGAPRGRGEPRRPRP
ncbi:hypothetical protein ASF58_03470 [Methylobacterium sp. Leaf125]|nr:hypothetical protein ASF58_03470 [Methylobacterium sp. Leaf125]